MRFLKRRGNATGTGLLLKRRFTHFVAYPARKPLEKIYAHRLL